MKATTLHAGLRRGISTIALLAGFAAMPAQAQDQAATASPAPEDENEVIVTAQFRQQNLQDTPLSITAVTGDTLEARGAATLADVGAYAPNVTLREAPATYGPAVAA